MRRPRVAADQDQLTVILDRCPELAALHAHVHVFTQLITERRGRELGKWINAASSQPGLGYFINVLRRDQDAVTARLSMRWNSGPRRRPSTASR